MKKRLGYREFLKEAHKSAAQGREDTTVIDMGKTASGNPRFTSRSDGAEAGVVRNGIQRRFI